ncbi:MAG TPA: sulfatase [Planctomycetaceae bacterium]|nr:sulfatase [Planctomycetaceae bacterium]
MRFAALVAVVFGTVCCTRSSTAADEQAPSKPNVLFIAIDDLNDWIGCLGGHPQVETPHMDRLAARGMLFTNAHCQSPLCNPSRTSLLTGLRPSTTGVYALEPWIRSAERWRDVGTLPQHFAAHGYRTYTTGKIWHGGYPPRDQRESEFHVWGPPAGVGARPPEKLVETPFGNHPLVDWGTFPHRDEDKGDWPVASWAVERLESRPQEPFFLATGFFLPHVPCYATQKWFDLYPEDALKLPPVRRGDRDDTPPFSWYLHWKLPEPRLAWAQEANQWQPLVRAYLASISFVDSQVGRVLDALETSGMADRTIVVLWSDHGFHLGEKAITGKNTLWERSTRVPLIFAGPGIASGARCDRPAELLDLYPTLSELCGLEARLDLEGHSLAPLLQDASAERPWPAITTHGVGNHAIRSQRWRYIHYADGSEELYDLERDPHEWTNLAGAEQFAEVQREHARWLPQTNAAPLPGSRSRLLEVKAGVVYWEGAAIRSDEPIPME